MKKIFACTGSSRYGIRHVKEHGRWESLHTFPCEKFLILHPRIPRAYECTEAPEYNGARELKMNDFTFSLTLEWSLKLEGKHALIAAQVFTEIPGIERKRRSH